VILFVWDLHGVLERGNETAVIAISNEALTQFGYVPEQRFTRADIVMLYGKLWHECFAWLLRDGNHRRHLELQQACFEMSLTRPDLQRPHVKPTPHAHEVLRHIAAHHRQIVISNTRPKNLRLFLDDLLDLGQYFPEEVAFAVDRHSDRTQSKAGVLADYLSRGGARYDEIRIIGDSASDIALGAVTRRLAPQTAVTTYLFVHSDRTAPDCEADHVIADLREVLQRR
jgi:phosphoglycolate phosphatase-like HAD superfamily hydrolase